MGFWFLQTIFSRSIIFLCATVHNFFDWLWFLHFFWGFSFFPRLVNKVIKTVFLEFHQPFWCLFLGMGHCPTFFATVCRLSCTTCTLGNYFVSWFSLEPRRKQHSTNPLYVDRAPLGVSLWKKNLFPFSDPLWPSSVESPEKSHLGDEFNAYWKYPRLLVFCCWDCYFVLACIDRLMAIAWHFGRMGTSIRISPTGRCKRRCFCHWWIASVYRRDVDRQFVRPNPSIHPFLDE